MKQSHFKHAAGDKFGMNIYIRTKFHINRSFLMVRDKLLHIRQQPSPHSGTYNLVNTKNHSHIFEIYIPFREINIFL